MCINKFNLKNKRANHSTKKIIIILNFNSSAKLKNAKPCLNCIKNIYENTIRTGIYIHKIYYSTGNGDEIICEKFMDLFINLLNDPIKHECSYGSTLRTLKLKKLAQKTNN